jgi:hypothetical protein
MSAAVGVVQAVARDGNVWEWRVIGPAEWLAWSTGNGTLDQVPQGSVEAIYASYVLQVTPARRGNARGAIAGPVTVKGAGAKGGLGQWRLRERAHWRRLARDAPWIDCLGRVCCMRTCPRGGGAGDLRSWRAGLGLRWTGDGDGADGRRVAAELPLQVRGRGADGAAEVTSARHGRVPRDRVE